MGRRKIQGLLQSGAKVHWVAPELTAGDAMEGMSVHPRQYRSDDVQGVLLVFAATGDPELNDRICREGREAGALVCRVEQPAKGDFSVPAIAREGALQLTVSSGGTCPAFAALLRDRLREQMASLWGEVARLAKELRQVLIEEEGDAGRSRALLDAWLTEDTLDLLATGEIEEARRLLLESVTPGDRKGTP